MSFQSRHTLSSDVPASSGKGINAAAEWIKSELEAYSKACGGCLEVKTDEFTQETGNRIPKPTKLTNVYAILKGSDPANASRIILISGHYDSRNTETNDATGASPGANDDGSGTAVSMESARVLSQHKFAATLIFLIVAGEEQGLYGSAHFATMAKMRAGILKPFSTTTSLVATALRDRTRIRCGCFRKEFPPTPPKLS